jgi:DNA polymerase-3 subunit beta
MKILCNRQALLVAVGLCTAVALTRTPKPVLTCVKLVAEKKSLTIMVTDMERTLQLTVVQVDVSETGSALIPVAKLQQILANSPDDTITLECTKDHTIIKGSDAKYKVFGYDPEEFPPFPRAEDGNTFTTTAGDFTSMLDRTRFSAAKEMTRYAINGVLFEKKGKALNVVATDGHRLSKVTAATEDGQNFSAVMPLRAIALLEKLLDDPERTITLTFTKDKMYATIKEATGGVIATVSSSMIEGTFPPYADVIPQECDKKVTVNRARFASAVRRAALLTNEESKGVRLCFSGSNSLSAGKLDIRSRAPEMGEANLELHVEYTGEAIEIGFNPLYLLDCLKAATTEQITLEMKTPSKPGLIRSGADFLHVIMPVNLT